jgi:serine/threonine-protein phosphatase 4 regulatory subunit 1
MERVAPKSAYEGLTEILIKQVYEPFFQQERHDEAFKQTVLEHVLQHLNMMMEVMNIADKKKYILPIILEAMKDEEDEERRLMSVILTDELAQSLGLEICRDYLMYDFISLQDDPVFKVRKEVAVRLMKLSRVLGEKIFNGVMIPVYRKLSQDQIWSVRKACVE